MNYNQVPIRPKTQNMHPSNTQGELHSKQGFITSTSNTINENQVEATRKNHYKDDEFSYQHNFYSNRSHNVNSKPYEK